MDLVVMYGICSSTVEMFYGEFLLKQHDKSIKTFGASIRHDDAYKAYYNEEKRNRLAAFNPSEHEE